MKPFLIIIISLLILFIILSFLVSYFLCRYYARPNRRTLEEDIKRYEDKGILYNYKSYKFEEFKLTFRDEVEVNGRFFNFNPGSNKYIILVHGFGATQVSMSKYMEAYKNIGFNVITYDERGMAENKITNCGMSYFESYDVIEVIKYVKTRFGKDIILGIHGESMGGASVIGSMKYKPNVNFIVADCPFANLKLLSIKEAKKRYHVPMFIINLCGPVGKLFFGYNPNKVIPTIDMNNTDVPLLVCHGDNDNLVPMYHSEMIYNEYKGPKELHITKGADHAEGIVKGRDAYTNKIKEFVTKYINK